MKLFQQSFHHDWDCEFQSAFSLDFKVSGAHLCFTVHIIKYFVASLCATDWNITSELWLGLTFLFSQREIKKKTHTNMQRVSHVTGKSVYLHVLGVREYVCVCAWVCVWMRYLFCLWTPASVQAPALVSPRDNGQNPDLQTCWPHTVICISERYTYTGKYNQNIWGLFNFQHVKLWRYTAK